MNWKLVAQTKAQYTQHTLINNTTEYYHANKYTHLVTVHVLSVELKMQLIPW